MALRFRLWAGTVLAALLLPCVATAQGLYLPGGGAAHLSMGGASTATPVDAIGALYWNPAAIGRLGRSEVSVGGAFLFPNIHLESTGLRQDGRLWTGDTRSDSGVGVTSNLGVVYQPEEGPLTYGLGLNTLGGGGVNFPGDLSNPVLAGVGPLGNVQGPIYSNLVLVQMTPTVAYKVTDRLVFGFGPTVDVAVTSFNPAYFGSPNEGRGDRIGTFPYATNARPFWGGGVRAGLVYSVTDNLDVGFGYTSQQWFETWKYYARTELGLPRTLFLTATLPAIYSWGVAYRPTEKLLLAVDLRYLDYKSTDLFGTTVANGGLGWQSVFAAAVGGRYQVTDRAALSLGYVYNENPIPSTGTLFNIQAPAITQHTIAAGGTFNITEAMALSLGYAIGLPNSITGPVKEEGGTGVKLNSTVQMLTFTLQFRFGGGFARKAGCGGCESAATPATPCPDPTVTR